MPDGGLIDGQDVKTMVRLLGEVIANPGDHATKKRQMMDGLCQLIDADSWVWTLRTLKLKSSEPSVVVMVQTGGLTAKQLGFYQRAVHHPVMVAATAPFLKELLEKRTHLTRLNQQIDPENVVMKGTIGDLIRGGGVGPIMASFRPLDEGRISAVSLYRRPDRPLFQSREARIAHIVLSEVPWLHLSGWSKTSVDLVPTLAARPRAVLNLLVSGVSRKEIAASLKISQHTADGYVKTVFRHFNVNSQSQLINRFFCGDGGDTP